MFALARSGIALVAAWSIGACGGDERVGLRLVRVPTTDSACGNVLAGNSVRVRALGDFPASDRTSATFPLQSSLEEIIDSFPAAIEGLSVEVLGPGGGAVAVGRTAPFDFEELDNGAELPVFLAPEDGACEVGSLSSARAGAVAAASGDGVIILGGVGGGQAVTSVERYDRASGQFTRLIDDHYGMGERGFVGASLTAVGSLVVAVGGPVTAWQSWDASGASDGPRFLPEARAFHAAAALADGRIFLAGGCSQVSSSYDCDMGSALRTTSILDPVTGDIEQGPRLSEDRIGGKAFLDIDGSIVLVGGVGAGGDRVVSAERLVLGERDAVPLGPAPGASAAQLSTGSVVVGLGAGAAAADVTVVPALGFDTSALPVGRERAGATMTATEDGAVLVIGGGEGVARLRPFDGVQAQLSTDIGGERSEHVSALLADGAVLIAGGRASDGQALADAWVVRPPLLGPSFNGDFTVRFGEPEVAARWIPRDPERVAIAGDAVSYALVESAGLDSRLDIGLVAGPRLRTGTLTATVSAPDGIGVVLGFGDGVGWLVSLEPGAEAAVAAVQAGVLTQKECELAEVVAASDVDAEGQPVSLSVEVDAGQLVVRAGTRLLVRCQSLGAPPKGYWGLSAIGPSGSLIRIDSLTVSRRAP